MKALFRLIPILTIGFTGPASILPANQTSFPRPFIENIEGWNVEFDRSFMEENQTQLFLNTKKALANHLQRILFLMPPDKALALQKLVIRVDRMHTLTNMQYHPSRGWLEDKGFDPTLEKRVHVPRAHQLLDRNTWLKHPYVILHELAHSYHDQVLGFDYEEIKIAYQEAEKAKLYERVLLFRGGMTRHYARTNHKEFFAEMTESYVGVNDFYPFVRAELKNHDPKTFALMKKIWGSF
jgi:hypothetical protein